MKGVIVTITGASCSGKSVFAGNLARHGFPEVRSFTTRAPRPNEKNGQEYDFIDQTQAFKRIDGGEVIEWTSFAGNLYGSTTEAFQRALAASRRGAVCVVVDPGGVQPWQAYAAREGYSLVSVFLEVRRSELIHRAAHRLEETGADRLDSQLDRLRSMLTAELSWGERHDYTLRLRNNSWREGSDGCKTIVEEVERRLRNQA